MPDELRDQLQRSLGLQYTLQRELTGGGMSRVFVAHEPRLGRDVVVKVLSPEIAGGLSTERFEREIRLAAALQEPHVVPVLAAGTTAEGLPFYTMPFVTGESLRERLRRGPVSVDEALRILHDVATALEHAHASGVVHRDVKPENVLLSGRTAVVTDFGIAKAIGAARTAAPTGGAQRSGDDVTALTVAGTSIGTPAYMSPEQALGVEVDPRTDLYAWGVLAYEALSGAHPFAGRPALQLLAAHIAETPPPLVSKVPRLPAALASLVTRCLAKDAASRPQSASEILRVLDGLHDDPMMGRHPRRAVSAAVAAALVVALLGILWWRSRSRDGDRVIAAGPTADRVVAVLPFENLGAPSDAYFADGVSDAVRGKLASLPQLTVIARTSSVQYRGERRSLSQVARELGARWLLTGTVRWTKTPDGTSRVQVSPELVEMGAATAPAVRWQQPFDASLTDVFQVQADIASRVAEALDVALDPGERGRIAARPTRNLDAYDAYLRGEELTQGWATSDAATMRRALPLFERAVQLDSTFAGAWTRVAYANLLLHANVGATPQLAESARRAAERAVALAPTDARAHAAMGTYYAEIQRDFRRSMEAFARAERLSPHDAEVLHFQANAEATAGRQAAAVEHALRAATLDPRSGRAFRVAADRLAEVRRLREAESLYVRAQLLSPRSQSALLGRVIVKLMAGDLAGAQRASRDTAGVLPPEEIVATLAKYSDLFWTLDDEQQRLLLRLRPDAFDADTTGWALALAQTYALRGDMRRARVYAESARAQLEHFTRTSPRDPQHHALLGLSLGYLGRHDEARRQGERAVALAPITRDLGIGPYVQHQLVRIHLLAADREAALDRLEPLLSVPYALTPAWLRIDPAFAPLRDHPRFERLIAAAR